MKGIIARRLVGGSRRNKDIKVHRIQSALERTLSVAISPVSALQDAAAAWAALEVSRCFHADTETSGSELQSLKRDLHWSLIGGFRAPCQCSTIRWIPESIQKLQKLQKYPELLRLLIQAIFAGYKFACTCAATERTGHSTSANFE